MAREIKFRAWDKQSRSMVNWKLLMSMLDGGEIATTLPNDKYVKDKMIPSESVHVFCYRGNFFNEAKFILMQFTGLKDKNGKEIYEGDVIKFSRYWSDHFEVTTGSVFFFEDEAVYLYTHGPKVIEFPTLGEISKEVEIIGNIYENPELVKP